MSEKFWENFEKIDNEDINSNMDKLDAFIKQKEANETILNILNKIDANNSKDVDMAYNPYDEKYYIKVDGEINKEWLTAEELINKFWTATDMPEIKNSIEINETDEEIQEIKDTIDYLERHLDEPQEKDWKQITAEELIYDLKQILEELEYLNKENNISQIEEKINKLDEQEDKLRKILKTLDAHDPKAQEIMNQLEILFYQEKKLKVNLIKDQLKWIQSPILKAEREFELKKLEDNIYHYENYSPNSKLVKEYKKEWEIENKKLFETIKKLNINEDESEIRKTYWLLEKKWNKSKLIMEKNDLEEIMDYIANIINKKEQK